MTVFSKHDTLSERRNKMYKIVPKGACFIVKKKVFGFFWMTECNYSIVNGRWEGSPVLFYPRQEAELYVAAKEARGD